MALDLDDLGGHVSEVLRDTRDFEDPWGWGIQGTVLRGDHPDWRQFNLDHDADRPVAEKVRRVTAENVFSDMAPTGFRRAKKPTKGEAYNRMIQKLSEKDEIKIDIFDLRERKDGIATILCKALSFKGETIVRRRGKEFDLSTPDGRAQFFDHSLWDREENGEKKTDSVPVYERTAEGETKLDDNGDPIEQRLGGWNIGDALAQLIVDESKDLAAFVEVRKAAVLDRSGSTSNGSTVTGSPLPPTNDA